MTITWDEAVSFQIALGLMKIFIVPFGLLYLMKVFKWLFKIT